MSDFLRILPLINSAGIVGVLAVITFLFVTGRIRPGNDLDVARADLEDMRKDRDDWKAIAARGTDQARTLVDFMQLFRSMQISGGDHKD